MAEHTPIEWSDATLPNIAGCNYKSKGCRTCWAVKDSWRLAHNPHPKVAELFKGVVVKTDAGELVWTQKRRLIPERNARPLRWRKGRRIFICSQSDLFDAPDWFIDQVVALAALCPRHTLQVLTKEAGKMRRYFERLTAASAKEIGERIEKAIDYLFAQSGLTWGRIASHHVVRSPVGQFYAMNWPLPNLHVGVTAEDQENADKRIPDLLAAPVGVRWISAEPLLGAIDLRRSCELASVRPVYSHGTAMLALDWVVAGGESGKKARPMHPAWARSLRDQCAAARVPFLFKQWGAWVPWDRYPSGPPEKAKTETYWPNGEIGAGSWGTHGGSGMHLVRVGKKAAGRLLDGRVHTEFPAC